MRRVLALDVGDVRIGIAVSDPLGITANGLESYTRKADTDEDAAYIATLADKYRPVMIVVGMPRNMNGTYGPRAEKTREFADVLSRHFDGEIDFYDERLTTVAAEKAMLEADMSRKKRRKVVDKVAAVIILQSYMESVANRARREGQ